MSVKYNLSAIRDLLLGAFSAEELKALFYYSENPDLRDVVHQFMPSASLLAWVQKAVGYCERRDLLDALLAEVKSANPRVYAKHGPYHVGEREAAPMTTSDIQQRILQAIAELQSTAGTIVADDRIAGALGLDLQDVRDHLDLMQQAGLVKLYKSTGGTSAELTARGRVARKDPAYLQPANLGGDTIVLSGNFTGAFVNISSILDRTSQSIGTIPHADPALKEELERLVQELKSALQPAVPDRAEEAQAVAEFAQELVDAATEEKPNKVKLRISADLLKKAAENIATVVPPVLALATQIAETIIRFTGAG